MDEMRDDSMVRRDAAQAAELALLVELEAQWENMRISSARAAEVQLTMRDLHGKQKAYEAFRTRLAGYNKRYTPAHVPELLLNTPVRLGTWCRTMREVYVQVEQGSLSRCPVHLVEKAYRWADRVAARSSISPVSRSTLPNTIQDAIQHLDALATWCAELAAGGLRANRDSCEPTGLQHTCGFGSS